VRRSGFTPDGSSDGYGADDERMQAIRFTQRISAK
jgi:hypothetical protein